MLTTKRFIKGHAGSCFSQVNICLSVTFHISTCCAVFTYTSSSSSSYKYPFYCLLTFCWLHFHMKRLHFDWNPWLTTYRKVVQQFIFGLCSSVIQAIASVAGCVCVCDKNTSSHHALPWETPLFAFCHLASTA